jgi:hypothetical protein
MMTIAIGDFVNRKKDSMEFAMISHAQLERELSEAKFESDTWRQVAEARLTNFEHYHDESLRFQGQLTTHKAALEKCHELLTKITQGHFYQSSCRGGEMERLMNQAIQSVSAVNPNQESQ